MQNSYVTLSRMEKKDLTIVPIDKEKYPNTILLKDENNNYYSYKHKDYRITQKVYDSDGLIAKMEMNRGDIPASDYESMKADYLYSEAADKSGLKPYNLLFKKEYPVFAQQIYDRMKNGENTIQASFSYWKNGKTDEIDGHTCKRIRIPLCMDKSLDYTRLSGRSSDELQFFNEYSLHELNEILPVIATMQPYTKTDDESWSVYKINEKDDFELSYQGQRVLQRINNVAHFTYNCDWTNEDRKQLIGYLHEVFPTMEIKNPKNGDTVYLINEGGIQKEDRYISDAITEYIKNVYCEDLFFNEPRVTFQIEDIGNSVENLSRFGEAGNFIIMTELGTITEDLYFEDDYDLARVLDDYGIEPENIVFSAYKDENDKLHFNFIEGQCTDIDYEQYLDLEKYEVER